MKICTVVGARPQFIKAAALSRVLRKQFHEVLIHTGQHYDANMSDIFFEELDIPRPDYHLGLSGGSHGKMTGQMLQAIEERFMEERPDMVLVYGDTNSTLAGSLAAVKLQIPIAHVEAGVRMKTLINPEEVNRVLTDRISSLLLCCTHTAIDNLQQEGITAGVYNTGDLMYDALLYYKTRLTPPAAGALTDFNGNDITLPSDFYLMTCHREENTGSDKPLKEIFTAMQRLDAPVIYPVHPRNRKQAEKLVNETEANNIILANPVGYLTSLYLVKNAKKVVTDSGGLQREAWFLNTPCVTLLDTPPWPETMDGGWNQLCKPNAKQLTECLNKDPEPGEKPNTFGDGHSAEKITDLIVKFLSNHK